MTPFILAAAAIALVALLLLLRPWRRRVANADFSQSLNAAIHRDRLAELERDRANGTLSEADLVEAKEELQRQLLEDVEAQSATAQVSSVGGRGLSIVLALCVPLVAVLLYLQLGSPTAVLSSAEQAKKATATMEELVAKLAQKLEENPDNPEGWAMLARSYKAVGRFDDAERAFGKIGPAIEKDARLLADLADLLIQKNGGFAGRPRELLKQALKVNPDDPMSLWLAGTDAFDSARYGEAIKLWEHLLTLLEPDSEDARTIEAGIAQARERSGKPGKKVGPGTTAKTAVSGRVELAPELRGKAKPEDVVFVFARAVNGPRMPLAAQRARVADLPLNFSLDDGQALSPEATISKAGELRVEVRISKSGNATPGKGDLTGKSAVVKPGATGIVIKIDTAE